MSLLFIDSVAHYSSSQTVQKYTTASDSIIAGYRVGSFAHHLASLNIGLPNIASTKAIMGMRVFPLVQGTAFQFNDTGNRCVGMSFNPDGSLTFTGPNVTVLQTPAGRILFNQWYYMEIVVTMATGATGSVQFYLNGTLTDSVSNVKTAGGLGGAAFLWSQWISQSNCDFQDIYVADGSGVAPWNTTLGDVEIDVVYPNGAGASTQWTPLAATNWQEVSEIQPDGDTTYNHTPTVGNIDEFTMQPINTNNGIIGAQLLINARRPSSNFANLAPVVRRAGVDYVGTDAPLGNTYAYYNRTIYMTAPDGTPWSDAIWNSIQCGYKKTV